MNNNWEKIKDLAIRFQDLSAIGFGSISASAISAIFWFYIASLVGVENYGEISYYIAIAGVVGVISMIGSSNTVTVYTAKEEKILPQLSFIVIIIAFISSIALFFILYYLGASLYVLGYVIFGLATAELLGKKFYKDYSKYIITQRLLMVGLALAFYYLIGPHGVIIGVAASFFPYSIRLYQGFKGSKLDFSFLKSKRSFMINSYFLDLSRIFSGSVDKLIVAPLFGFTILGNYQLGIQFLTLLLLIPSIVANYTLPQDASGLHHKKLKKVAIIASVFITLVGITLGPIILPPLFPKFLHAKEVVQIMSLAAIPGTINFMYTSKLLGTLKNKILVVGSVIYVVVQVLSIIALGNLFGINGIASGYVISSSSEAIFLIYATRFIKEKAN